MPHHSGRVEHMQKVDSMSTVTGEEVEYQSWKKAFLISNDTVQLIVLTEVGPRILFFGFRGDENEFHDSSTAPGDRVDREFKVYGGHRLWVSPEVARTYYPDNFPVQCGSRAVLLFLPRLPNPHLPERICRKSLRSSWRKRELRLLSRIAYAILDRYPPRWLHGRSL